MTSQFFTNKCLTLALMGTMALGTTSCGDDDYELPTNNTIECITDANKFWSISKYLVIRVK